MRSLNHPNLLEYCGTVILPDALLLVTPLYRRSSLEKNLYLQDQAMPLSLRLNILLDVARGLSHLHVRIGCRRVRVAASFHMLLFFVPCSPGRPSFCTVT